MADSDDLSQSAQIAYQAFVDMKKSKAAHFTCLEGLQRKYESGGAPSLAENLELEKLLAAHDKNVLAFKTALAAVTDEAEKQQLIEMLS